MKKQLLVSGLALSLFIGGAGLSSKAVDAAPVGEDSINLERLFKGDEVQPMFWSAVGQAVHMLLGGSYTMDPAQKAVLGKSNVKPSFYNYEEIIETFDLK